MRVLTALLLLGAFSVADAQSLAPAHLSRVATLPAIGLPLPPIGLPLPPIGLPQSPPLPAPTSDSASRIDRMDRAHGAHGPRLRGPGLIYVVPVPGWGDAAANSAPAPAAPPAPPAEPPTPAAGTLRLELLPRPTGQLFVDGAYVGTVDDLGLDLTLYAGIRQLEIREPGYRPFTLTAHIAAGRALVYQGTLEPDAASAARGPSPEPSPVARKPLYFIPGCYLGDVPPRNAGLPPTCDPDRAVVFRP